MTRLKFLVFALIALGLWVAHLFILSPLIAAKASDAATGQVGGAAAAVALRLETQRSYLQGALLKAAASPAAVTKGTKAEAPTADRVSQARGAVQELVPEALRDELIVGIINDSGGLFAVGTKDPSAAPDGFDLRAAGSSGGKGEVLDWGGPTLFHSTPIYASNGADVKQLGAIVAGLPLAAQGTKLADEVAKELGLSGVAIVVDGKITSASTGSKAALNDALKALKPGTTGPVVSGTVAALGPLKLPLAIGSPALEIGARRDIPTTPYEVIAMASDRPMIEAIAGYQKTALMMLAGLLLAAIGFTVLIGGGGAEEEDDEQHEVQPVRKVPPPSIRSSKQEPLPALLNEAPPPEAHPDDFNFGPASSSNGNGAAPVERSSAITSELGSAPPPASGESPATMENEQEEDPFAKLMAPNPGAATLPAASRVVQPLPRSAPPPTDDGDFDDARTVAYPAHRPPGSGLPDPFAMASAGQSGAMIGDDQPDATRVAAIPAELLKQSARTTSGETTAVGAPKVSSPLPTVKPVAPAIPAAAGNSEEAHFMEVFKDFVSTRDRCGEPADGLTYEKFSAKLRKNKDQLIAKYSCRTVRFSVYVKDGKAALKATPVKD